MSLFGGSCETTAQKGASRKALVGNTLLKTLVQGIYNEGLTREQTGAKASKSRRSPEHGEVTSI